MTTVRLLSLAALLVLCAGCGGDNVATKEPPSLLTVSPDALDYGDTIIVTGSGFNPIPSSNRLVISQDRFSDPQDRRIAIPLEGSRTRLVGLVPDGAFEGSLRVEDVDPLNGPFSFDLKAPAAPSNTLPFHVRLSTGNVGKAFFAAPGYEYTLTSGDVSEDYLLIVFNSNQPPDHTWTYLYSIRAQVQGGVLVSEGEGQHSSMRPASRSARRAAPAQTGPNWLGERQRDFERKVRQEIEDLMRRTEGARPRAAGAFHATIAGSGAAPLTVQFKVIKDAGESVLDPANFTTVTASLRFSGTHTLLYVDDETPPEFLTAAEAETLGSAFNGSIYETDRSSFGSESDINGDGKVAILMSPAINRLTLPGSAATEGFIAGYFLMNDLLPGLLDSRVTNGMEIFYSIVPDPTARYGNVYPKDQILPIIRAVLAHEFLHMILFNYRVLVYAQGLSLAYWEELWMNEGLAHIAENLNGYKQSNVSRANLFLGDPGNVTLIYGGDDLEERGASFLFLRYLGDRFGDSIFKQLVQSSNVGVKNVEAATGTFFKELFADWSAACYLTGRGVTGDARFNYSSIDLRADFRPLTVIEGSIGSGPLSGYIKAMAPEYILFTLPPDASVNFAIGSELTGKMNAVVVRVR